MESLLGGVKLGASTKRKHDGPLPASSWYARAADARSMICKRAWFIKLRKAEQALEEPYSMLSYYESKHPSLPRGRQRYVELYQSKKAQLRGNISPSHNLSLFFEQVRSDPEHDHVAARSASDAPLAAWLVTPRRWSDFIVEES